MTASQPPYAYLSGQFLPLNDAKVSIKNPAFLYGISLFEGIRGYWLPESRQISIFRLEDHYRRLLNNSRLFHLTPTASLDELCELTIELILKNQHTSDIYIRPTLFQGGESVTPMMNQATADFCIWTQPLGEYIDISKGLNVCVSTWRRVSDNAIPARAKAGGAYMNTALAITDARSMGFDDAIFLTDAGTVSEGSAMNLFLIKDGLLHTPGKTDDILEGITRDTLITIVKNELGMETLERTIDRTELYQADEAFFCGTGAQVAPIAHIDGRPVGSGKPGPLTQKIQALYFDVVKNKYPQYKHWSRLVTIPEVPETRA